MLFLQGGMRNSHAVANVPFDQSTIVLRDAHADSHVLVNQPTIVERGAHGCPARSRFQPCSQQCMPKEPLECYLQADTLKY